MHRGYVASAGTRKGYRLGPRISEIYIQDTGHQIIITRSKPRIKALREEMGDETCYLAGYWGDTIVLLIQEISTQWLACGPVSETDDLHATALGKIRLSTMSQHEIEHWIRRHGLPRLTHATITDADRLLDTLNQVRSQGYATHIEERTLGIFSIAVPVFTSKFGLLGIACAVPLIRYTPGDLDKYASRLRSAAEDVSCSLNNPLERR
jgi:DNA-binding IclR family transcriptional regulator